MTSCIIASRDIKISPEALKLNRRYSMRHCSIKDCSKKHYAKSYCSKHYQRMCRYGDPNEPLHRICDTHGMSDTSEYVAWCNMISRCYNSNNTSYKNYGGSGVSVCARWKTSFEKFYTDMGNRPSARHSLDRIDPYGDYSKENCRWATPDTQSRNKRLHHSNKTGIPGVHYIPNLSSRRPWRASIFVDYRNIYIGIFETIEEAATARRLAEEKYWRYV